MNGALKLLKPSTSLHGAQREPLPYYLTIQWNRAVEIFATAQWKDVLRRKGLESTLLDDLVKESCEKPPDFIVSIRKEHECDITRCEVRRPGERAALQIQRKFTEQWRELHMPPARPTTPLHDSALFISLV